ncbi:MAG: hypothetical protein ABEJ94_06830 [Halorientalis sp.]
MNADSRGDGEALGIGKARWARAHQRELAEALPAPRCAWRWGETELTRSTIERMNEEGLIDPVDALPKRWQTTRKLWRALPRYCDDQSPGTLAGQVRFDAASEPARTRYEAETGGRRAEVQRTLSDEERRAARVERERGPGGPGRDAAALRGGEDGEDAGDMPGRQQTLIEVCEREGTREHTYSARYHHPRRHPDQATLADAV